MNLTLPLPNNFCCQILARARSKSTFSIRNPVIHNFDAITTVDCAADARLVRSSFCSEKKIELLHLLFRFKSASVGTCQKEEPLSVAHIDRYLPSMDQPYVLSAYGAASVHHSQTRQYDELDRKISLPPFS